MREGRPSTTAAWVAGWRGLATYAEPAIISDPIAEQLIPSVYARIVAAGRRHPRALAAVHAFADKVSGGRSRHLALRTRAIDEAVIQAVSSGVHQLVLVGAGLDGRAWRMPVLRDVTVYEVDHPATQGYKRTRIASLEPLAKDVRFIASDFERDDLAQSLAALGHDASSPTIFIWEGVTMYLTRVSIERMLRGMRSSGASGSVLLATYFERIGTTFARALATVLKGVSEPVQSAFSPSEIASLFQRHGFAVIEDAGDPEWSPRYLGITQSWSLERMARAVRR